MKKQLPLFVPVSCNYRCSGTTLSWTTVRLSPLPEPDINVAAMQTKVVPMHVRLTESILDSSQVSEILKSSSQPITFLWSFREIKKRFSISCDLNLRPTINDWEQYMLSPAQTMKNQLSSSWCEANSTLCLRVVWEEDCRRTGALDSSRYTSWTAVLGRRSIEAVGRAPKNCSCSQTRSTTLEAQGLENTIDCWYHPDLTFIHDRRTWRYLKNL